MTEHNRKLLIVDDDPGICSQLKWGLEDFEVVIACDKIDALKQFAKFMPPVVTLDLGLPPDAEGTMEGFDTLSKILDVAPETRVVIVSGSDKLNARKALESGAFGYFSKPVNIQKLNLLVEQAYQSYLLSISSGDE